jgi:DNA-binding response OmpR family regulator
MAILIADDDLISRSMVEEALAEWGHEVKAVADGQAAWEYLQSAQSPILAILDWVMPELDGIEVCVRARALTNGPSHYLILLTALKDRPSVLAGLRCGANDFVCKPFDPEELRARVDIGLRVLELQERLAERVRELEKALAHVKRLQGILPICSYCKKIRNDQDYWQEVDRYLSEQTQVLFSHGICPDCLPGVMEQARRDLEKLK